VRSGRFRAWLSTGGQGGRPVWRPVWSEPAALRAVRATLVVPSLFALTFKVIGDPQMALFATFGGFATLVVASFGGSRRDKLIAHLGLAVVGSIALVIGTAVSGTVWLAAIVTLPVTFAIFFAGEVAGPNAASGVTAALFPYVLPVVSAGSMADIPSRLAGWWLASAVGTAAVLLLSAPSPGDRLRASAADTAAALATYLDAALRGDATSTDREAAIEAKRQLIKLFSATPYRPTGLATADQALASAIQTLEWCTTLISDALVGGPDPRQAAPVDRELLGTVADVLRDIAATLRGQAARPDLDRLERLRAASAAHQRRLSGDASTIYADAMDAVHAQTIALAARGAAADSLIAAGRAGPKAIEAERRRWYGAQPAGGVAGSRLPALPGAIGVAASHTSVRSVWFRSSVRAAVALAVAVAVADISGVEHGFWVVLGTLSVLRSNSAATGSTVIRALLGTVAGFVLGAVLLLAIGTDTTALWVALPIAVFIAAYTPGTAPFAFGQAAFTITVVVLFNLLVPAGWRVGLLRVEDVAIGCAVSLVVGVLFWPRGAGVVVGDDLADAFRSGAAYLTQAVDWALGRRREAPDTAAATISAGIRLEDALRAYLAEQGAKPISKDDLWSLVMATTRLRLTAYSLASLCAAGVRTPAGHPASRGSPGPPGTTDPASPAGQPGSPAARQVAASLSRQAAELASFYDRVATAVGPPSRQALAPLTAPALDGPSWEHCLPDTEEAAHTGPHALWVRDHLQHLGAHADAITEPALRVAQQRRRPWWL
jgi:uncharacterized membrane protein YccC